MSAMSKKGRGDPDFRAEVAKKLKEAIGQRKLTKSQAAALLNVKRQTLWLYLAEKSTPGGEVLKRACELWNITLSVKGFDFSAEAFSRFEKPSGPAPQQMTIAEVLDKLRDDQIEAKVVGRVGDSFELRVRIRALAG